MCIADDRIESRIFDGFQDPGGIGRIRSQRLFDEQGMASVHGSQYGAYVLVLLRSDNGGRHFGASQKFLVVRGEKIGIRILG